MGNSFGYHRRSNSVSISGIYSSTDEDYQVLSSYQKVVLRAAWRLMSSKSSHSSCGRTILKRLNLKDSSVKIVFQHFSVLGNVFNAMNSSKPQCGYDKHAEIFAEFLDFIMANLDHPNKIAKRCEEIGRAHRRVKVFGMKTDHLDLVGESITETVREYQGWRRHRQAVGATNIIISFVVDRIRSVFAK
ncbi:hypothetical protein FO519_002186 [Halicephalobus sp. NKZ332]|nr:hypothetical protein FO519_002186 [Halicephalobus sp. NKZ332]